MPRTAASIRLGVIALSLLALVFWFPATAAAQLKEYSVEDWNLAIEKGSIGKGARVAITGRKGYTVGRTLNLQRCPTKFLIQPTLGEIPARAARLLLVGTVTASRSGKQPPQVEVDRIEVLPSDLEDFFKRRRGLAQDSAEAWRDLGLWARGRGEFYRDNELMDHGDDALKRSIDLLRRTASRAGAKELFALAEQAKSLHLDVRLQQSLRHEAWNLLWKQSRDGTAEDALRLAETLHQDLEGCDQPAENLGADLLRNYELRPVETYDSGLPAQRRSLHRYLYASLLMSAWTKQIAQGGVNGFEVASRIEMQLPEYAKRAEELRTQVLASRAGEVDKLTRKEVLLLAEQYRQRQQQLLGHQVIESWVELRRKRLTLEDTESWLEIAADYRTLLGRPEVADRLLMEIWSKTRNPDLAEALEKAGYRLKDGIWLTEAEFRRRPEGRLEQALREGRIEVGMSDTQVRQALGRPATVGRTFSAGLLTETWSYGEAASGQVVVQLTRRRHQKLLLVESIGQLRARLGSTP